MSPRALWSNEAGEPIGWMSIKEKGSRRGILLMGWVSRLLGRRAARLCLHFPVLYFVVFHPGVRRISRRYLTRVSEGPVTFRMVYRHVMCFARVTLDRLFLLQGRDELFEASYTGHEYLERLFRERRGAILLSAHIGSSAAMNLGNRGNRLRINIAGYFRNARMVNSLLQTLNPETFARVIHLDPSQVSSVLAIKEKIRAGEMIALTGDRSGINDRAVVVPFLGAPAEFPTAPFLLASVLHCPVYLVFALYQEPNRYHLFCEPFAEEGVSLPRVDREARLGGYVRRYAERVEHYCRQEPNNWFAFYDFWAIRRQAAAPSRRQD